MVSLLLVLIYICFISLGLPDSLLGSAWPVLHAEIDVPMSFAGFVSMTIFLGTILSSLFSNKLLVRFGAGKVTAVSTALTAAGLLGLIADNISIALLPVFQVVFLVLMFIMHELVYRQRSN